MKFPSIFPQRPPQEPEEQSESAGDLATTWNAVGQADIFRLMERETADSARTKARCHAVEDAIASRTVGATIDTSGAKGEDLDVRTNSDNVVTHNYYAAPPPHFKSNWTNWLFAAILLALLTVAAITVYKPTPTPNPPQPPTPIPSPNPTPTPTPAPSGHWGVSVQ